MNSVHTLPELLLPAGGFDAGVAAFKGGADAVYLGLQGFSARRQAKNFDSLEYRRLLRFAHEGGKKIYVALNTIVKETEYSDIAETLVFLSRFTPDAIIFQDWGLASLILDKFPRLTLHASTQTAIQSPDAAHLAQALGVKRIVLPREMTLEDLRRIKRESPSLEYEVFVHGALCYSYSGLCLASGLLLGRSGNRGACAQLCRSYYSMNNYKMLPAERAARGASSSKEGFWFSCRDLDLVDELRAIIESGAASIKVEGRMKSPEYVYSVAKLYRKALDGFSENAPSIDLSAEKTKARIAFSRTSTRGYAFDPKGQDLLEAGYPGHRGVVVGQLLSSRDGRAVLRLDEGLGLRDGLLALPLGEAKTSIAEPLAFSVMELRDERSGRELRFAPPGSRVEIALPSPLDSTVELRQISSRNLDLPSPSPEEFPPEESRLKANISIEPRGEGGSLLVDLELPELGAPTQDGIRSRLIDEEILPIERAKQGGGFSRVEGLFSESGQSDFRIEAHLSTTSSYSIAGEEIPLADLFVPPSLLKKAKNRLYEAAAREVQASAREYAANSLSPGEKEKEEIRSSALKIEDIPARRELVFAWEGLASGMPFALPRIVRERRAPPRLAAWLWLPLSPLVADWPSYALSIRAWVEELLAAGEKIVVGIDTLHHAAFAKELSSLDPGGERLAFFGDIHLYVASRRADIAWRRFLPSLSFEYAYIEDEQRAYTSARIIGLGDGFEAPLFLSKACLARYHLNGGHCPADCGKSFVFSLADRQRRYEALVDDCVTMLFRKAEISAQDGARSSHE